MVEYMTERRTFTRELERHDGRVLSISQYEVGDVGCVVWDAALVLSFYLESADFTDETGNSRLFGKSVVELGSGTGVVGIQAAACGARCIVTDLEEFVPLMQLNIDANNHLLEGSVRAEVLCWGTPVDGQFCFPDYVLFADCIYYEASVEPLFQTVCELTDLHTVVLCCYEERHTGNKPDILRRFLQLFATTFTIEPVPSERQDATFHSEDIHILRMMRKS